MAALALGTLLTVVPSVFAAGTTVNPCPTTGSAFDNLCGFTFANVVGNLVVTIFIIAIIVALFYLIWGGFKWLTSGGDKGQVQAAREHIVAAIIGLIIIFLSYFILNIILTFFGLSLGTFTLPSL